jgi:DNA-directed RNA polymerase subunit RPC12/RpoP
MDKVECPRCGLKLDALIHRIISTDAQACPRCEGRDDLEVPMFLVPDEAERSPGSTALGPQRGA